MGNLFIRYGADARRFLDSGRYKDTYEQIISYSPDGNANLMRRAISFPEAFRKDG